MLANGGNLKNKREVDNAVIRWNYDLIKEFVKDNSRCTLLSTEFKTAKDKMSFKCYCGNIFETTFEKFRLRNKRQCTDCGHSIMKKKQSLSYEDVKKYVLENSKCELLSNNYINTKSHLKFKCKCGEVFKKSFEKFKSKEKQCKKCSYSDISKNQTFTYEYVRDLIYSKNCTLLDTKYIDCETKLNIKCSCGEVYSTDFNSFKNYNQIRCRRCTNQMSKGEIIIEEYLKDNNFDYITQYKFNELRANNNKHMLKFDFAVFRNNKLITLIEFDGKQHFEPVEFYGGIDAFNVLKHNDEEKNNYCKDNGLNLIRINYKQINDIGNILNNFFYSMTIPC